MVKIANFLVRGGSVLSKPSTAGMPLSSHQGRVYGEFLKYRPAPHQEIINYQK